MVKNPPAFWFIPSESILHPETREPVFSVDVAYSLECMKAKFNRTGVDYVHGTVVTLDVARKMRNDGIIVRFTMRRSEG
jgi:hypothetical protein